MIKKTFILIISFVLVLCIIPITVIASDKGISYQVSTFVDSEHPEKGLVWKTEYCTDYVNLSEVPREKKGEQIIINKSGWYVVDEDISIKNLKIDVSGVNIILKDGKKLTIKSGGEGKTGYKIPTLYGYGTVNIYSQENNSGILKLNSKGSDGISSLERGAIFNIYGGHIIATADSSSSHFSAGIGGVGDLVNIYGGNIESYGGQTGPGIASFGNDDNTHLNIYGGTIYAEGGDHFGTNSNSAKGGPGIGGSYRYGASGVNIYGGEITAIGKYGGAGIGGSNEQGSSDKYDTHNINIYGGKVTATGDDTGSGIGTGEDGTITDLSIYGGTIIATGGKEGTGIGSSGSQYNFKNIKIYDGNVTAIGNKNQPGIGGDGKEIYIFGGTITANGGENGAGIGSGYKDYVSGIHIEGGDITATGGSKGAGIGTGFKGESKEIYITGGTVNAQGGIEGAGIGGSYKSDIKNIYISGGNISSIGGKEAAGLGGGKQTTVSNINITGGTVNAEGGEYGSGIGGGNKGAGNNISISSGIIVAKGGKEQGAGIGGGDKASANNINISGGQITATAYNGSAGIGAGRGKNCGNITITGGFIDAHGGYLGPAIGSGTDASSGTANIKISNAVVLAHKVDGGGYPAIGLGPWSKDKAKCNIEITRENEKVFNYETKEEITNNQYGTSTLLVTNVPIIPKGIKVQAVKYDASITDNDKEKMEELISKFSIKASGDLALLESQMNLAKKVLELSDEEIKDILSDSNKYIDISVNFEVTVNKADFSNEKEPYIDYALNPVATAKLYDSNGTIKEKSLNLTIEDFETAKGKLEVTMPVPKNCSPTVVRHTSDGGEVYNEFKTDGLNCKYDKEDKTITVYIDHCSHLVTYFKVDNDKTYSIKIVVCGLLLVIGISILILILCNKINNKNY